MTNEQKLDKIRECVEGYFKDLTRHRINATDWFHEGDPTAFAADFGYVCITEIQVHLGVKDDE